MTVVMEAGDDDVVAGFFSFLLFWSQPRRGSRVVE
jgi:hypothetical protein